MMSLCLETAFLVLRTVRQPLLPHHHVTSPVCQLIYVSLENLRNEAAPPSNLSPGKQVLQMQLLHQQQRRAGKRGAEDLHNEALINLMSLVRGCGRAWHVRAWLASRALRVRGPRS
jgi:hypothetical protein